MKNIIFLLFMFFSVTSYAFECERNVPENFNCISINNIYFNVEGGRKYLIGVGFYEKYRDTNIPGVVDSNKIVINANIRNILTGAKFSLRSKDKSYWSVILSPRYSDNLNYIQLPVFLESGEYIMSLSVYLDKSIKSNTDVFPIVYRTGIK